MKELNHKRGRDGSSAEGNDGGGDGGVMMEVMAMVLIDSGSDYYGVTI